MIIPCEQDRFVSIDVRRIAHDEVFFGIKMDIVEVKIIAWFVNEKDGLALPVLMNGVRSKPEDIIVDKSTGKWCCGHDRGFNYGSMHRRIRDEITNLESMEQLHNKEGDI